MILSGHHMLGAEVEERADLRPAGLLNIALVVLRDARRLPATPPPNLPGIVMFENITFLSI